MSDLNFSESDIPFEELKRFGLTRQMIEDLPHQSLSALLKGKCSPVLPLRIRQCAKNIKAYGRFRLVPNATLKQSHTSNAKTNANAKANTNANTQGKKVELVGVLFLPRLTQLPNDLFPQNQMDDLNAGKTIKVALPNPTDPMSDEPQEYYCQLDHNTRQLLSVPAQEMEQNMQVNIKQFQLNKAECQAFLSGTPLTVYAGGSQMSIGVDLRQPSGIRMCKGDTRQWQYEFDNNLDYVPLQPKEYHFATNGCWIESQDGTMDYIDENDYDQTIEDQLRRKRYRQLMETYSQGSFFRGR